MTQNEEELSPEQRDRLLRELKERLKEIEKLKQSLHVSTSSEEEKNSLLPRMRKIHSPN